MADGCRAERHLLDTCCKKRARHHQQPGIGRIIKPRALAAAQSISCRHLSPFALGCIAESERTGEKRHSNRYLIGRPPPIVPCICDRGRLKQLESRRCDWPGLLPVTRQPPNQGLCKPITGSSARTLQNQLPHLPRPAALRCRPTVASVAAEGTEQAAAKRRRFPLTGPLNGQRPPLSVREGMGELDLN